MCPGEKVMIPGELNIHRVASNTQHHPGPVEDAMGKKEKIPSGWNRQREASNTQHDPGPVQRVEIDDYW